MKTILISVEVDSPVHRVYLQWTRFEEFPHFMHGVKRVILLDNQRLHWETEFSGRTSNWSATITDLTPDERIAWESEDGEYIAGIVTFDAIGSDRSRVDLKLFYGDDALRAAPAVFHPAVERRIEEDLNRFKKFIEEQDAGDPK